MREKAAVSACCRIGNWPGRGAVGAQARLETSCPGSGGSCGTPKAGKRSGNLVFRPARLSSLRLARTCRYGAGCAWETVGSLRTRPRSAPERCEGRPHYPSSSRFVITSRSIRRASRPVSWMESESQPRRATSTVAGSPGRSSGPSRVAQAPGDGEHRLTGSVRSAQPVSSAQPGRLHDAGRPWP